MNNGFSNQNARPGVRRIAAIAFALALMTCAGAALSSCGHEPEKATPPANIEAAASNDASSNENDATAEAETKDEAEKASDEKADASAAKHQGAYVTAIRNGGGADGLAGAAQAKLVAAGLAEDTHSYSLDSYTKGLAPTTVVYVKGIGDDAEDVKAEAEKMVAALGVGSVQTFDQEAAGESMDALDILVIIGEDARDSLK